LKPIRKARLPPLPWVSGMIWEVPPGSYKSLGA